ncbi:MAG: hypothetical protein ACE5I5_19595, partial [Candidatus Heimdallarchaeota archaeon]
MRVTVSALMLTFLVSISAGALLYTFVTGLIGSVITNIPSVNSEPLTLNSAYINNTHITANIRNTGNVNTLTITYAFIDGAPYTLSENVEVPPDSTATVYIIGKYNKGNTYAVRLVCSNGYAITF